MPRAARLSPADELSRASADLDIVIRQASAGPIAPRDYHRLEAKTQQIADALRAAWRGRTT